MSSDAWPALPLDAWDETRTTLHMYLQVVGKIRLALSPPEPDFNQVALYVTSRGLTTGPMPYGAFTCQIDFDFIAHQLVIVTSDGRSERIELKPRSVRDFYAAVVAALKSLAMSVTINPKPQEVPNPIPFDQDTVHAAYDAPWVNKYFRVLSSVDMVFKRFRSPYRGRHSEVNVWWGSCDIGYARYSGRPAAPPPNAGYIMRNSMDAQEVASGFWAGDERYSAPAFYAYAYPKPEGFEIADLAPKGAAWNDKLGEFVLPYDDVRNADSPEQALLDFLVSTYEAARILGNWPAT